MPYYHFDGVPWNKYSDDMKAYLEIVELVKPDFVIECGTQFGGATYQIAELLKKINNGKIITIDIQKQIHKKVEDHPNVIFIEGNSTDPKVVERIKSLIHGRIMVCLDSNHQAFHVKDELEIYGELVSEESYLICEDTFIDFTETEKPKFPEGGPYKALQDYLSHHPEWEVERKWEGNPTYNPHGYLRKKGKTFKMKICYYPAYTIESGSSRLRVFYMKDELEKLGHEVWLQSAPFMADIIVIQKNTGATEIAKEAKKRGIPVVFDYCDPGPWKEMISLADMVTTDSQGLLDQYGVKNGKVMLNPPDLLESPLPKRVHTKEKALDLVYFAFPVNLVAFHHCRGALERLRAEGYDFTFTYISGEQNEGPFQGFDHKWIKWTYEGFSNELQKYDLAVIPQEWDWKGPSKQLDCCAHNVPAICGKVPPNEELYHKAGLDEYLAKNDQQWYDAIKRLFDPKERNRFLDQILPVIWSVRSREYCAHEWEKLFLNIIRKKRNDTTL